MVKTYFLSSDLLYNLGLALVIFYLMMGIDDFIWDLVTLTSRFKNRAKRLDLQKLDAVPPKLLAVIIAAWREDNVLGEVIDNIIASLHYPKSMYHIFLGVYPNDTPTVSVASALAQRYPNVHLVVNCLPGPTSKAQNVNYVITQVKAFEKTYNWRFASITIHDSEDVVHPYELKATNFLIDYYPAIQFPVFPIVRMPKFSNYLKNITTGTYADEFAENHFTTMVNRRNVGAFVPSAGTGFALSRATIDLFGDDDVLPRDSLTEDYRLSLTLYEKGISMYYVLERVPRISRNNKLTWDFIATRSMFPNTFKTAVKQKTRWILGITMQSFKFRDIFKTKGLRFAGRYSLYKDIKAKVGNLVSMVGYPVLIYFIISLFLPLTPIYPEGSFSWYLSLIVTGLMLERQIFRGVAIYNVYGMRSAFFACLFPPLFPLRLVWGNVINLVATLKAYRQFFFGNQTPEKKEAAQKRKMIKQLKGDFPAACKYCKSAKTLEITGHALCQKRGVQSMEYKCRNFKHNVELCLSLKEAANVVPKEKPVVTLAAPITLVTSATAGTPPPAASGSGGELKKLAWDKTDHTFLEKSILKKYHRNLGDILLEKGSVTPEELRIALQKYDSAKQTIGNYLVQERIITERELLSALSRVKHIQFLDVVHYEDYDLKQFAGFFDERILRSLSVLPLLKTDNGFLIAFCEESPQNAQTILRNTYEISVIAIFASLETVTKGLDFMFSATRERHKLLELYGQGVIDHEQVIIGSNYLFSTGRTESELLSYMGLLTAEKEAAPQCARSLEEAI